jgi:hypothetical protein
MSSSYSPDLRIELIANGEQSGTWGSTTNNNLGTLIEEAIAGLANVNISSANQALTAFYGAADQARCAAINLTTTTVASFNIYVPPVPKLYVIINSSAYAATVYASTSLGNTTPAGSGVSIAANSSSYVRCDGANMRDVIDHISGTLFVEDALTLGDGLSVANNLSVTGSAAFGVSQTATITTANPAVITVANAPQNDTTVSFTTTGALPANITAGTLYYVTARTPTTFRIATSIGGTPISTISGSQSGTHTVSTVPTAVTAATGANSTQLATTGFVTSAIAAIPGGTTYQTLAAATVATTANITLSATQNIDGVTVAVGDRVLVKDQTSAQNNGVYVVAAGAWARATDANTATELAAAQVPVLKGTDNGGKTFTTGFKSTDTLGTTAMYWPEVVNSSAPTIVGGTFTSPAITGPAISSAVMTEMASSVITSKTAQSASGSSVDFADIPSWVKRVTVLIRGVSLSGTGNILIRLGTASEFVATGYIASTSAANNGGTTSITTSTLGFPVYSNAATRVIHATMTLHLVDTNYWLQSHILQTSTSAINGTGAGTISLSEALTSIRITTLGANGTTIGGETFDAGTVNIFYE